MSVYWSPLLFLPPAFWSIESPTHVARFMPKYFTVRAAINNIISSDFSALNCSSLISKMQLIVVSSSCVLWPFNLYVLVLEMLAVDSLRFSLETDMSPTDRTDFVSSWWMTFSSLRHIAVLMQSSTILLSRVEKLHALLVGGLEEETLHFPSLKSVRCNFLIDAFISWSSFLTCREFVKCTCVEFCQMIFFLSLGFNRVDYTDWLWILHSWKKPSSVAWNCSYACVCVFYTQVWLLHVLWLAWKEDS